MTFLLIAFTVVGCDFDSRKFESAQHILPSSKHEWHRFDPSEIKMVELGQLYKP